MKFIYVPAEKPYYISEEIECSLWKKVIGKEAPGKRTDVATGMNRSERLRFAEICSRNSQEALIVASAEQIVLAEQQHIIEPFQPNLSHKPQTSTHSIQRKRKVASKLSSLAEMIGVRMPKQDDPVLLQFKKADDDSRPLRLVMYAIP